jgi:hypothetical protein
MKRTIGFFSLAVSSTHGYGNVFDVNVAAGGPIRMQSIFLTLATGFSGGRPIGSGRAAGRCIGHTATRPCAISCLVFA